jgi:drug/metabolite transporter (DMT)-like permease
VTATPAEIVPPDNRLRGILLILGAMGLFSLSDAMAKFLGTSVPAVEIAWLRYVVFVAMTVTMLRTAGARLRVRSPGLQILRGVMLVSSAVCFMVAIRTLPLAEAASIGFVSPLLITALSVPLLGEVVTARRWGAVALGLVGVLVVVRPGSAAFQPAALFALGSAASWAVCMIVTRKISGIHAATTLVWSSVTGLVLLSMALPFDFVRPTALQLGIGLALGVVASSGQALLVLAYRLAPASLLAPFSYTQMLWAVLYGYLLFGALPDPYTLVGAAVIAVSGVITVRSGQGR